MIPLNQIQVPTPCGEDWDGMDGDAQRRFCAGCGCHVHDLSAMTAMQAQTLLDRTEARVCVRFQTRPDGTVVTQEAMTAPERAAFWPRRLAAAASWALALALTGLGGTARAETTADKTAHAKLKPQAAKPIAKPPRILMGKIAFPRHTLEQPTVKPPKPPATLGEAVGRPTMGAPMPPPPRTATMGIVSQPPKK